MSNGDRKRSPEYEIAEDLIKNDEAVFGKPDELEVKLSDPGYIASLPYRSRRYLAVHGKDEWLLWEKKRLAEEKALKGKPSTRTPATWLPHATSPFTQETETGYEQGFITPDSRVWLGGEEVGRISPETGEFVKREPSLGEKALGIGAKWLEYGLEGASKSFATLGMPVAEMVGEVEPTNLTKFTLEQLSETAPAPSEEHPYQTMGALPTLEEVKTESRRPYEEYEELPVWEQILLETPGLLATGGITATGIRAGLAGAAAKGGIKGAVAKIAGATLKPAELVEKGTAKAIEVPIKGLKKVTQKAIQKIQPSLESGFDPAKKVQYLPTTEFMVGQIKNPSIAGRAPGWKQALRIIDPTLAERDPITVAKAVQGRLRDLNEGYSTLAMTRLDSIIAKSGKPAMDEARIVAEVTGIRPLANAPQVAEGKASMAAHDIAEWLERYDVPAKYRPYFEELRSVSKETSAMLEDELGKYGIKFRKMAGESDWVYIRRVAESVGEVDRIGLPNWREMQKARVYETVGSGAIAPKPVVYAAPEKELEYQIQSTYEWIASLRVKEILTELTTTAKARVAPEVISDLIDKNARRIVADKIYGTSAFPSLLTRVGRGEKLSPQTLAMVRRQFPDVAEQIGRIMGMKSGRPKAATELRKLFRDTWQEVKNQFWDAKKTYQFRLQSAGKKMDEGTGWFLPGRIFTTQELAGQRTLGRDIAYKVDQQFGYRPRGIGEKVIGAFGKVGTILRQTKAALDLSVQGIQTLPALGIDAMNLITLKPSAFWLKGAARGWQSAFKPASAMGFLDRAEVRAIWGEFAPYGALFNRSEYAEATHILGKIPVVGKLYERLGAAFTIGRQATQTYLLMGERGRALKGLELGSEAFSKRLKELAEWSNLATGVMSTRGMGISATQRGIENVLMFAPRYNRSVFSLVMNLTRGGYTGAQARRAIGGLMAAAYAWGTFVPLAMGQKPRLNPLPASMGGDGAKWLTVRVGNSYIGVGGTVYGLARLFSNNFATLMENPDELFELSMDNATVRFLRGKLGPPGALAIDLITGHDFLGELTRDNLKSVGRTFGDWAIPIWVEGMIDAMEAGSTPWQSAGAGVAEFFGGRTLPHTDYDELKLLRELYSEQDYNRKYDQLRTLERDKLFREHSDLSELQDKVDARNKEISSDPAKWYSELREYFKSQRDSGLDVAANALISKQISKYQYDQERSYIRPYYSGANAALWAAREQEAPEVVRDIQRWIDQNEHPHDRALSTYQEYRSELMETAELPKDWDAIEQQLIVYLSKYDEATQSYIRYMQDAWIDDLPENAQKIERARLQMIEDGTWWDGYRDPGIQLAK